MNKYNSSKIYKIYSDLGTDIYIGSTYRSITDRYSDHVKNYLLFDNTKNYTSSFKLFDKYGVHNCCVVLLEDVNVESRSELLQVEAKHIKANKAFCVNKNLPFTSEEEKLQNKKEYRQVQEYIEHRKAYRDTPEQKQKRRDYNAQRYNCECGYLYCKNTPRAKKQHFELSEMHLKYLLSKQTQTTNITINIQTVQTLNTNPIFKTEAQELDELEKEFENLMK